MGHAVNNAVNFDSPSAAAAIGALGMGGDLGLGFDTVSVAGLGGLGTLGKVDDDERAKRLENVIDILNVCYDPSPLVSRIRMLKISRKPTKALSAKPVSRDLPGG
jgi:hypothetical protein